MGVRKWESLTSRFLQTARSFHQRRKQCSQQLFKECEPSSNENDLSRLGCNGHGGSNQILAFCGWGESSASCALLARESKLGPYGTAEAVPFHGTPGANSTSKDARAYNNREVW